MISRIITSGRFELDGGSWAVDNNVWLIGDDREVIVVDPAHDFEAIEAAVAGRHVRAIVCTHAHNDHVNAAPDLSMRTGAAVYLHPADEVLWDMTHPGRSPSAALGDGQLLEVAGVVLQVLHTPGHAPGAVCFYAPDLGAVWTGDTLFNGGPGATGRSYSSYETIIDSIKNRLMTLPPETVVHTGHGDDTTIAAEAPTLT